MNDNQRDADLELLDRLLACDMKTSIKRAFEEMRTKLVAGEQEHLRAKQRAWAEQLLEEHQPAYENLWSSGKVQAGKPVATPEVLKKLPMRPPGRAA